MNTPLPPLPPAEVYLKTFTLQVDLTLHSFEQNGGLPQQVVTLRRVRLILLLIFGSRKLTRTNAAVFSTALGSAETSKQ